MSTNDELFNALFGDDTPTDEDFDFLGILNSLGDDLVQNDMAPSEENNPYVFGFNPANSFQAHAYQLCVAFVQSESAAAGIPVLTTEAVFQLMPPFLHLLEGIGVSRDKAIAFGIRMIGGFMNDEHVQEIMDLSETLEQVMAESFRQH